MKIKLPISDRKKALFVVDIQPQTLKYNASHTMDVIKSFLRTTDYALYVVAAYHADANSMLYRQGQWLLPKEQAGQTDEEVATIVNGKQAQVLTLSKNVRSCFKAEQSAELKNALKACGITEVHLIGYDLNDCVLASAYDAIDRGFYAYVIEEACHTCTGDAALVEAAIKVLRHQNMTNNSTLLGFEEIELLTD